MKMKSNSFLLNDVLLQLSEIGVMAGSEAGSRFAPTGQPVQIVAFGVVFYESFMI
jgi:hypothetical protein